jgi:hypothetical protein
VNLKITQVFFLMSHHLPLSHPKLFREICTWGVAGHHSCARTCCPLLAAHANCRHSASSTLHKADSFQQVTLPLSLFSREEDTNIT